ENPPPGRWGRLPRGRLLCGCRLRSKRGPVGRGHTAESNFSDPKTEPPESEDSSSSNGVYTSGPILQSNGGCDFVTLSGCPSKRRPTAVARPKGLAAAPSSNPTPSSGPAPE